MSLNRVNKGLVYLTVISSYISATTFSIDLGFMQVSLFRILILVLPFVCFAKLLSNNYSLESFTINGRPNSFSIAFMIFWLFYSLLSFLWSPDLYDSFRHVYFIFGGVISIVTFSLFIEKVEDVYFCLLASTFMIFIHGIIGWLEVFTGNYLVQTERTAGYALAMLPVSTMHNVNDFATSMAIGVFISFAVWKISQRRIISCFAFLVMISSGFLVIWSRSRANIYGLALAVLFLLVSGGKKVFKNLIIISVFLISFVFVLHYFFPWVIDTVFNTIFPGISGVNIANYGSDYIRFNLIRNGLHFLSETLFMGTGAGGIEHWMITDLKYDTLGITNIHNWWMEVLVGYGIFVFLGYLLFYFKLFLDMFRTFRTKKRKEEMYISLAMIGVLVSFVIGSISSSSNIDSYSIWVFFAIAIAFQGLTGRKN